MKTLILLCLFPILAFAQDPFQLTEQELNPEAADILIKKKEKYLRDEAMIYDFNTNLGIKDQRRYTGSDRNRFSMAGHVSGDYEHFNEILGLDVNYMRRSTRYNQIWWGGQFFYHKTYFNAITQNQSSTSTNPNADSNFSRPGSVRNNVMAFGPGVGYRFKLLLDFLPTEDWFENIDVFANYLELDETFIRHKYRGYGLTTNYGIHKRASTSYFYGGKISYNVASVTRDAIGSESRSSRSLALGWLTFAFELGFFY